MLSKNHCSHILKVVDTLNVITKKSEEYASFPLFQIHIHESQLPQSLQNFEQMQKTFHMQAKQTLQVNWRGFIISEIQDRLRNIYKFY